MKNRQFKKINLTRFFIFFNKIIFKFLERDKSGGFTKKSIPGYFLKIKINNINHL